MYLKEIIIENFRAYKGHHRIKMEDLTAFIGRNDAGKSTIFDALAIFFKNSLVKIDESDVCVQAGDACEVRLGCVFTDYPNSITIDTASSTNLVDEYLLNNDGDLEIHKIFNYSESKLKKERIVAITRHPSADKFCDLLYLKNAELKELGNQLKIDPSTDKRSNVALRKAIWSKCGNLALADKEIQLDKEDAKRIWEKLEVALPEYALFRADRSSTDEDDEVQDPLKIAVKLALTEMEVEIEQVKEKVKVRAFQVAERTIEKLNEIDGTLASQLKPDFKTDPKWDSLFKLSLTGDDNIPINKRGSGVRRLIVFSFFRAEAERVRSGPVSGNIIYAVEEPETAQHPNNQRKIIEALKTIAETDGFQVLLTTHVPALASLLPNNSIRYITHDPNNGSIVKIGSDDILKQVATELGVLPDSRVRVLVCMEGPHDFRFLEAINPILRADDQTIIDIFKDARVALVPLGGSTLQEWVNQDYLKNLGLPEVHIYDRDMPDANGKYPHEDARDAVNNRGNGSIAFLTNKREIENYLHLDALNEVFQPITNHTFVLNITDDCDVEKEVISEIGQRVIRRRSLKHWLNDDIAKRMTLDRVKDRNGYNEIRNWLMEIGKRV